MEDDGGEGGPAAAERQQAAVMRQDWGDGGFRDDGAEDPACEDGRGLSRVKPGL